jgi:hypothetical protein
MRLSVKVGTRPFTPLKRAMPSSVSLNLIAPLLRPIGLKVITRKLVLLAEFLS